MLKEDLTMCRLGLLAIVISLSTSCRAQAQDSLTVNASVSVVGGQTYVHFVYVNMTKNQILVSHPRNLLSTDLVFLDPDGRTLREVPQFFWKGSRSAFAVPAGQSTTADIDVTSRLAALKGQASGFLYSTVAVAVDSSGKPLLKASLSARGTLTE